ncbi:hypothetical protein WICMUC_001120 [Wickerhamomyces mucosus]|uniref:Sodium/calcium exchanger membrane region domain-containing protein n=1 Tax=Wickerhamomyces mucosus TaxID=1378264 RepID=A0A9P8TI78_9ASCO|nr:hypothetical protein WICMUC_001120 [Wickerhamomyces mucosus]
MRSSLSLFLTRHLKPVLLFVFFSPLLLLFLIHLTQVSQSFNFHDLIPHFGHKDYCEISKLNKNSTDDAICRFFREDCDSWLFSLSRLYFCPNSMVDNELLKRAIINLGIIISLFFIFISFGVVTSNHLYPNLESFSKLLHISKKLSGLILLAIGNATPDLSSLFNALSSDSSALALGELIGSCNFILGFIIGSMGIFKPFKVNKYEFIKDFCVLSFLTVISLYFLYDQNLSKSECLVLLMLYLGYIMNSIRTNNDQLKEIEDSLSTQVSSTAELAAPPIIAITDEEYGIIPDHIPTYGSVSPDISSTNTSELTLFNRYKYSRLERALSNMDVVSIPYLLSEDNLYEENIDDELSLEVNWTIIFKYMSDPKFIKFPVLWKIPVLFPFNLIIPVYPVYLLEDDDRYILYEELRKYKVWLFHIQTIITPLIFCAFYQVSEFPILILIISITFVTISFLFLRKFLFFIIPLTGFITAVLTISLLSSVLIMLLKNLGVILRISESLLGLTILSLGNSIGDLISNLTLNQLGLSIIGINACFGSVLLYFGVGIGLNGLLIMIFNTKSLKHIKLDIDSSFRISGIGLVIILGFYLIAIPLNGYYIDKKIGITTVLIWGIIFISDIYMELNF